MAWQPKFKKGDIICFRNSTRQIKITQVDHNSWGGGGYYVHRGVKDSKEGSFGSENEKNYSLYSDSTEQMENAQTLYSFGKTDGTVGYGQHIGTNSQNLWLIEEKTTGAIHVFDKKDVEEVLPYTFSVRINGNTSHFVGTPDTLKVGDVLLNKEGQIGVVNGIDTKNKAPRDKFEGRKLVTEAI
jgi:hypothetical protein